VPRHRATLVAIYRPAIAYPGRPLQRRSFGTVDKSDSVTHTFQGFLVIDAWATFNLDRHRHAAFGVENIVNEKYFLFHFFPQRAFNAELSYRW
jgi:iron complex outermembrane receptor protein